MPYDNDIDARQKSIARALAKMPTAQAQKLVANALAKQNATKAVKTVPRKPVYDYVEDFTVFELDFLALAPGVTANQAIPIQADSAFKWTRSAYYATIANAAFTETARPIPSCTITVLDTGSGRQLFNSAVPVPSIFGIGQLPFVLPVERVFAARSSIAVSVTNFDAAVTYNLRLSFIGAKIFNYNQA